MKYKHAVTLAELVETVQDNTRSDDEAVAMLRRLLESGRVTLTHSEPGVASRTAKRHTRR